MWELQIFLGNSNHSILVQKQDPWKYSMCNFILYVALKVIWIVPWANWMFRLLQIFLPKFWCLIVSYYISASVAVKKEKSEMSFKSSVRPSCPIFEITTSHVCRLKRLEMRVIKIKCFSYQESEVIMSHILSVKCLSGCSE